MKRMDLSNVIKIVQKKAIKYQPEILTGIGIAGMISATIMAVAATPKAIRLAEDKMDEVDEPLTRMDWVKSSWKCYIPAAATTAISTVCLVGASRVNCKRNAALAAAYSLSESALKDYQSKVIETIGEKKERDVRDSIARDRVDKSDFKGSEVIITGNGDTLCLDDFSGQYFYSSIEKIRRVENRLNKKLFSETYISLNEFYYELGLRQTPQGNDVGWNISDGGLIDLSFSSVLIDDKPCIVVQYRVEPRSDYMRFS